MSDRSRGRRGLALAFGAGLVAGTAAWWVIAPLRLAPPDGARADVRQGPRGLVNPLLECPEGPRLRAALIPFHGRVDTLLEREINAGRAHLAAVYFRDLNNGPWFTAGTTHAFRIGSLLKVPLLLGYLKRAETDPAILQKRLTYSGPVDPNDAQNIVPRRVLIPGEAYTIAELLEQAIIYSDNDAAAMLARDDGGDSLETVRRLASFPPFRDGNLYLTPRHFASMFRILYNASYLDIPASERALELLSRSDFRDGLVRGVPAGVTVAHKFGERRDDDAKLHDCGIVYHPQRPYVLCVMTEGRRFDELAAVIAGVSQLAYDEVSRQLTAAAPEK